GGAADHAGAASRTGTPAGSTGVVSSATPAPTTATRRAGGAGGIALIGAVAGLAVGTYLFRLTGVVLAGRFTLPASLQRLLPLATVALLGALAVTAALTEAGRAAGVARPAGVLVGVILAWRRAPFAVVVVAAAATAAGLRLLGVP